MVSTWALAENGGVGRLQKGDIVLQALLGCLALLKTFLEVMNPSVELAFGLEGSESKTAEWK